MMESIEKLRKRSHLDDERWTLSDGRVMWYTNGEPNDPDAVNWGEQLRKIADEIEREIAEHYMELPVDADGVPIHVGDKMQYHGGEPFTVCAVAPGVIHVWAAVKLGERCTTYHYAPEQCTHYKPRTLEDVLREYALEMNLTYETGEIGGEERAEALDDLTAKYAAEIREQIEVDA